MFRIRVSLHYGDSVALFSLGEGGYHVGRRVAVSESAGKHRGSHRAAPEKSGGGGYLVGAVVLLLVLGAGFAGWRVLGPGNDSGDGDQSSNDAACGDGVTIATTEDFAPALRNSLRDRGCNEVIVEPEDPSEVVTAAVSGNNVPDYWIPDSTLWVDRVAQSTKLKPVTLVKSTAATPVVLAAAGTAPPSTWSASLSTPGLVLGDPLNDTTSAAPLFLATENRATSAVVTAIAPQAQAQAASASAPLEVPGRIAAIDRDNVGFTPATEQAVLISGGTVTAKAPAGGTWMLTYPLTETATGDRADELSATTEMLKKLVASPAFVANLKLSQFRPASGAPIPGGVGNVKVLAPPQPEAVGSTLSSWTTLAVPTQSLTIIDVSGSMDYATDTGGTRIGLTVAATKEGLSLFPNGSSMALWAFSERLGGGDQDWKELVPLRRLDAYVAGRTQREEISRELDGLRNLTDGGTGLYDTTLAGYQYAQAHYDPKAVNSVLLFSDGANDNPGSISLDDLLEKLANLANPDKPVNIITIGISKDADNDALRKIADATGGFSIIAERPEDMATLFRQAMQARFAG